MYRKLIGCFGQRLLAAAVTSLLLTMLCGGAAAERRWTTETVGRGVSSSIAIDRASNLHLVYLGQDAQVYYGFRSKAVGKWFNLPILAATVTHGTRNIYPRLTLDKNGMPHVCVAAGTMNYIALKGHEWTVQEIDPGAGTLSYHCSVAVGPDGSPHLSWYHEFLPGGKQFTHLRHADLEDGVWVVRSVDGGIAGKWNSMMVDSKGGIYLAYSQSSTGGGLMYATWDGHHWNIIGVDIGDLRGFDTGMTLAADGTPYVSYVEKTTVRCAHQKDGAWVVEDVASIRDGFDMYGGSTAVVLDSHGRPHVVFGDFGSVKEASWDGKAWQTQTVVAGGVGQYFNVDAAIGPDDTLYVSYPDREDGMVKIAIGKIDESMMAEKKKDPAK